jgi:plastocyanin
MNMIKQSLRIYALAITLLLIVLSSQNSFLNAELGELQTKKDQIEILILSRGFISSNPHYEPQNATAKVGTIIEWRNGDRVHHTVTSDEGIQGKLEGQIFDSGPIPPRTEFVLDSSNMLTGAYTYHCRIHPWARGMLTLFVEPIKIATDKPLYDVSEKITVSGSVNIPTPIDSSALPKKLANATAVSSVSITVFDSKNKLLLSKEVPVLSDGSYSYTFTMEEEGVYATKATVNSLSASTTFEVRKLHREKVTVSEIVFEDVDGKIINVAKFGQQIFIKAKIRNTLEINQSYTYLVQVKDSNNVTVFLALKGGSISPLGTSSPSISWTPENEGTYSIEVFIWNNISIPEVLSSHIGKSTLVVHK